jgi:type I restriction enzyme M protein
VKTNGLFWRRGPARVSKGNTKAVWFYDMRAGQPAYGKTRPLRVEDFAAFEAAYGDDLHGTATREDSGVEGRFRRFSRAEIAARADNLDITWLRGSDEAGEDSLEEPEDILEAMRTHLARALTEVDLLVTEFSSEPQVAEAVE